MKKLFFLLIILFYINLSSQNKIEKIEFDTGNTVPDNQQPQQLYMDLAWEGLNFSQITAWNDLTTQEEKDRVGQVIANYINNNKNETCTE